MNKTFLFLIIFFILYTGYFAQNKETPINKDTKSSEETLPSKETETLEEKEKREFREFQEFKKNQKKSDESGKDAKNPDSKKWFAYLQYGIGQANTEFEKGNVKTGKLGFEYRIFPMFGIGLGVGNNSLELKSKDTTSGPLFALFLLSESKSASPFLLFTALAVSVPVTYQYKFTTFNVDFNLHFNKDNFIDPYFGIGLIAGVCGAAYPCSVSGGEFKLGTQLNFDSSYIFFQGQSQYLNIVESGVGSTKAMNSILSAGAGIRF